MKAKPKRKLVAVYSRLFVEDVRAIKESAANDGVEYQVRLRTLVHNAVKRMNRKTVIS